MAETVAPGEKLLWTPREAAEALSLSQRTLWTLTDARDVPCVRIGRLVRYDPQALREWIAGKRPPAADSGARAGQQNTEAEGLKR